MYFCPPQTHPVPGMCLCEVCYAILCHGCKLQAKEDMNDLSGWSKLKNYIPSFVIPTYFPRTSKHPSDVPPLSRFLLFTGAFEEFPRVLALPTKLVFLDIIVYLDFLPRNEFTKIGFSKITLRYLHYMAYFLCVSQFVYRQLPPQDCHDLKSQDDLRWAVLGM